MRVGSNEKGECFVNVDDVMLSLLTSLSHAGDLTSAVSSLCLLLQRKKIDALAELKAENEAE